MPYSQVPAFSEEELKKCYSLFPLPAVPLKGSQNGSYHLTYHHRLSCNIAFSKIRLSQSPDNRVINLYTTKAGKGPKFTCEMWTGKCQGVHAVRPPILMKLSKTKTHTMVPCVPSVSVMRSNTPSFLRSRNCYGCVDVISTESENDINRKIFRTQNSRLIL